MKCWISGLYPDYSFWIQPYILINHELSNIYTIRASDLRSELVWTSLLLLHLTTPMHASSLACPWRGVCGWAYGVMPNMIFLRVPCQVGNVDQSSPCCANGFSISSLPSRGLMTTSRVPRATTSPRDLVASLPSSSSVMICQSSKHPPRKAGIWVGLPRITSCTSSNTRFMSASYPFSVPVTILQLLS